MSRPYTVYTLPSDTSLANCQVQATSGNTGDVQTLAKPGRATAALVCVRTNDCYLTVNGTTPSSSNGLPIIAGATALLIMVGADIKFASSAGSNSVLNVLWLE